MHKRRNRIIIKKEAIKYDIPEDFNELKINIITTTNEIDTYYSFLPSSYQNWKKLFPNCTYILGLITNKNEDSEFVKRAKKFCDKIFIYKELENVESGVQAKTTRMFLTTQFENDINIIIDIDYYLLNKKWLTEKIKPAINENKFITIGNNGYLNTRDSGKWQMCLTTAKSTIFQKILNPEKKDYTEWFNHYMNIKNPIDNKESLSNKFNNFSDESLFRYIMINHNDQQFINEIWLKQDREDFILQKAIKRIDRGWWKNSFNINKLNEGYFIDSQPLRPFDKNLVHLKPILYYLNIDINNEDLIF